MRPDRNDRIINVERRTLIGDPWRFDETLRDSEDSSKLNASQTGLSPNRRDISADHPGQLCYSPTTPESNFLFLYSFNCGAGVNAPPVSYAVDGKQYVAVAAGGNSLWGFRQGGAVVVFGLAD